MQSAETTEKRQNNRSLFRLDIEIPVTFTPFLQEKLSKKKYPTKMVDLSGSGCKIRLSDESMPETEKGLVEFKLGEEKFKLYCDVVRRNGAKRIVALSFTATYENLDGFTDPLAWVEERIIQYIFEQQRLMNKTPHFYRHKITK